MASTSKPQALLIARKQTSSLLSIHKRSKNSRFPSIPQSLPFSRTPRTNSRRGKRRRLTISELHLHRDRILRFAAAPQLPWDVARRLTASNVGLSPGCSWHLALSQKKKRQGNTHDYWWLLTLIIDHWLLTVPVIIVIIVILYWYIYIYIDIIDDCCRKWQELVSTSPSFGKTW